MKDRIRIQAAAILVCVAALLLACQIGTPQGMGRVRIQCTVPGDLTGLSVKSFLR